MVFVHSAPQFVCGGGRGNDHHAMATSDNHIRAAFQDALRGSASDAGGGLAPSPATSNVSGPSSAPAGTPAHQAVAAAQPKGLLARVRPWMMVLALALAVGVYMYLRRTKRLPSALAACFGGGAKATAEDDGGADALDDAIKVAQRHGGMFGGDATQIQTQTQTQTQTETQTHTENAADPLFTPLS